MEENIFGENIKHLRKTYNETLEELGKSVNCAKTTIEGYESGIRKPDLQTAREIAIHYHKTVDELLFTNLPKKNVHLNTANVEYNNLIDSILKLFPIYSSVDMMKNAHFQKGYNCLKRIEYAIKNRESGVTGERLLDAMECFLEIFPEFDAPEISANLMWCLFMALAGWGDIKELNGLMQKILSGKCELKDFIKILSHEGKEMKKLRAQAISDLEPFILLALQKLKGKEKWSDLADYYLSLTYIFGMTDSDLSSEMSFSIGIQMMMSFRRLGNAWAYRFYVTCLSIFGSEEASAYRVLNGR